MHCYHVVTNTKHRIKWFTDEDLAYEVIDSIYDCREIYDYKLLAFVIMPDHLHILFVPTEKGPTAEIMKEIKRTSSIRINKRLGRRGAFWQEGYYEDILDGLKMVMGKIDYIHNNPLKEGLCEEAEDYLFSSANKRWKKDWDYL